MKKLLFVSILTLGVTLMASAQHMKSGKGAYLGFKAGVNLSNVIKSGDSDFKSQFKPGLAAGIFVDVPITETFSFAPELIYSQKGYQSSGNLLGSDYNYKVTTDFVDVPLLAKFWPGLEGFTVYAGPQVSFLTATTESFKSGSTEFRNTIEEHNKNLKKSILAGVVGLGYEVGDQLGISARYALDFQKLNANGTAEVPAYKNQVIQIGLTYQF